MEKQKTSKLVKALKNPDRDKFQFSVVFQLELLKYLIQSNEAIMVISKIKSSYFTILEHNLVCESLLRAFKKYKKIPGEVVLLEHTQNMLNSSEFVNLTTKDDLPELQLIIRKLYSEHIQDEDIIKSSLKQFIAYIEMRDVSATTDFTNFTNVREYYQKVGKIIREVEGDLTNNEPTYYMVSDVVQRQLQRKVDPEVNPTPFRQVNDLTNAGGYPTSSIIVLLDKAKAKKTFTLLNVARGYLAMRKNVLYIDTENGANQIMGRMIQSTMQKTKLDILSGDYDQTERRHMRKYRNIKAEFIVKRVPAMIADTNTIRGIIQEVETEKNIKIGVIMIDYAGKLASLSRDKDDFERISNVYIDIQNMAMDLKIETIWTAHHITREGSKHQETRYEENDISGAISIIRNAQAILGLNQTDQERENNIQRMEVVVQRDGKPVGRALFHLDVDKQRMTEFTRSQRKAYDESQGLIVDDLINKKFKNKTTGNTDAVKAKRKSGDI